MIITCRKCNQKNNIDENNVKKSKCGKCETSFAYVATEESEYGFCSFCFENSKHILVEKNYVRRNDYQCTSCGKPTNICRFCTNFSQGGEKWDDELCAEHNGEVANFSMLNHKLENIENFDVLFEKNSVNIAKVGSITAATIGTAVAIVPLALVAAPAIGGAIGVGMGLSGAAATNAGLAVLGGGALAAGGAGMAGGVAILGATGAALGGTLGGVISNSYFSDVEGFNIIPIKEGIGNPVIFIDGFLSENEESTDVWEKELKELYPNNPWYYLTWESKTLLELGTKAGFGLSKVAIQQSLATLAKKALKGAGNKLSPVGLALTAMGIVSNPWSVACTKAGQTGIILADILARTDKEYILCGHSLGARVIYYALEALATKEKKYVSDVHLLGGAVGSKKEDWEVAAQAVSNKISNYKSENDYVLMTMYKIGTFFTSDPIGRHDIEVDSIDNVDVSEIVDGHTTYKEKFSKFCRV